jgi:hypothetical protein
MHEEFNRQEEAKKKKSVARHKGLEALTKSDFGTSMGLC